MHPKIGIIIPHWNTLRFNLAEDLVNSLNKIDYPSDRYTVFVYDDLSEDGSPEYLEKNLKNCVLVRKDRKIGFAETNNIGVRRCLAEGFDYAYLLNHDTEVDPEFLNKAVEMAESDSSIGAVQSRLILHQDKTKLNSISNAIHFAGYGFSLGGYDPVEKYPRDIWNGRTMAYPSGAGVLLNLDVIKITSLFDTNFFMYHEDLDLGWKIQLAGFKNVLAYDSIVYHKYEFSKSVQKYYYMERNRYIVMFENYRIATLILFAPAIIAFELGTLLFAFKSGFWKQKLAVYPYFLKASSWKMILSNRKFKQGLRKVSDRRILKTFSGTIVNQHISNPILDNIVNPLMNIYFKIARSLIIW